MVDDLMNNHLRARHGMTRAQVRALLGPPDAQSQVDKQNHIDRYDLGPVGAFGMDPSTLQLKYDNAGKLKQMEAGEE